jgi:hypothetical protein
MTRRQIVAALRAVGEGFTSWEPEQVRQRLVEIELEVENLPGPVAPGAAILRDAETEETLRRWRPGHSMVAMVPDDCLISLKAAVKAGARITIEPANPEG